MQFSCSAFLVSKKSELPNDHWTTSLLNFMQCAYVVCCIVYCICRQLLNRRMINSLIYRALVWLVYPTYMQLQCLPILRQWTCKVLLFHIPVAPPIHSVSHITTCCYSLNVIINCSFPTHGSMYGLVGLLLNHFFSLGVHIVLLHLVKVTEWTCHALSMAFWENGEEHVWIITQSWPLLPLPKCVKNHVIPSSVWPKCLVLSVWPWRSCAQLLLLSCSQVKCGLRN